MYIFLFHGTTFLFVIDLLIALYLSFCNNIYDLFENKAKYFYPDMIVMFWGRFEKVRKLQYYPSTCYYHGDSHKVFLLV